MIVVKLKGGLGNQMFQYALGRSLSLRNGSSLLLDVSELEDINQPHTYRKYELTNFDIQATATSEKFIVYKRKIASLVFAIFNVFLKKKGLKQVSEKILSFDTNIIKTADNSYLDGYWNSPIYFKEYADIIKKDFTFKSDFSPENVAVAEKIKSCCAVSIHIRRGDYVSNSETNAYHGTCSNEYYYKAIQLILEKNKKAVFFIFSDDPDWVHTHFKIDAEHYIVSKPNNLNGLEDMHLMTLCQHAIIANSTFSWWAAWLIENKSKIVIAPQKWLQNITVNTNDLFPNSWLKI